MSSFSSLSVFKRVVLKSLSSNFDIYASSGTFSVALFCFFESAIHSCFFVCLVVFLLTIGLLNLITWKLGKSDFPFSSEFGTLKSCYKVSLYWSKSLRSSACLFWAPYFPRYAWWLSKFPHIHSCFWISKTNKRTKSKQTKKQVALLNLLEITSAGGSWNIGGQPPYPHFSSESSNSQLEPRTYMWMTRILLATLAPEEAAPEIWVTFFTAVWYGAGVGGWVAATTLMAEINQN